VDFESTKPDKEKSHSAPTDKALLPVTVANTVAWQR